MDQQRKRWWSTIVKIKTKEISQDHVTKRSRLRTSILVALGLVLRSHWFQSWPTLERRLALGRGWTEEPFSVVWCSSSSSPASWEPHGAQPSIFLGRASLSAKPSRSHNETAQSQPRDQRPITVPGLKQARRPWARPVLPALVSRGAARTLSTLWHSGASWGESRHHRPSCRHCPLSSSTKRITLFDRDRPKCLGLSFFF